MNNENMSRQAYVIACKSKAKRLIFEENLPQASDLLRFKETCKISKKLNRIFEIFENKEDVSDLLSRKGYSYTPEESKKHIDSVIASNVKEISKNGVLYQQLLAAGDSYVVVNETCKNKGRKVEVPTTEQDFIYEIRDMFVSFDGKAYKTYFNFEDFKKDAGKSKEVWIKSPITCEHMTDHKVCKECAGKLPDRVIHIGAFATMLVTEADTQNALSSMNNGITQSLSALISEKVRISTLDEFYSWAENMLLQVKGDKVERRWYEVALISRLIKDGETYKVKNLSDSKIDDDSLYGNFIYKPTDKNYRALVSSGTFEDNSLQTQIAFCDF